MKVAQVSLIVILITALSACAVTAQQPIGYRETSTILPTYVNGQYVGMQPSDYVVSEQVITSTVPPVTTATTTYVAPTVVYRETTTPVYVYNPPGYVNPWYPWYGVGIGTGAGFGIGINYSSGCCRWHGHRGWHHHRHHPPRYPRHSHGHRRR